MTPEARIATAIELLDGILPGGAAEKTLTNWARRSRFAGSGDRAAIRDLVFDALRCRRSFGYLGGGDTGRGLMIGALRARGVDPAGFFTGEGYAAAKLPESERGLRDLAEAPPEVRLDVPDWLYPLFLDALGADTAAVLRFMQGRAPVFLRANLRKADRDTAAGQLQREGISCVPHPLARTALLVETNTRKVSNSKAFRDGLVELQDAASQAVCEALDVPAGARILDYCAGGGGKALALAAQGGVDVFAHDIDPARMRDLPLRAARAGVEIRQLSGSGLDRAPPFDLVLCDAPCSGSGAWRRAPEAKWRLTRDQLTRLAQVQAEILDVAAGFVRPGGRLAYATCSLFDAENSGQSAAFLSRHPKWAQVAERRWTPLDGGDGFYLAVFSRSEQHA